MYTHAINSVIKGEGGEDPSWKVGSVVKNTYSCKGPGLDSQHPHGGLPPAQAPSVNVVPNTQSHKNQSKKIFLNKQTTKRTTQKDKRGTG